MELDNDLKVIIDFALLDAKNAGKHSLVLSVPDDFKSILYNNLPAAVEYIKGQGDSYTVTTNAPDEKSWRGWDVEPSRQDEFPEGYEAGRDHSKYQLMQVTENNLMVKITF